MHSKVRAALSLFGLAALGMWLTGRLRKRPPLAEIPSEVETVPSSMSVPDIDDDTAAEIIRRAQTSLERARRFV
jgi:hypothetical protein